MNPNLERECCCWKKYLDLTKYSCSNDYSHEYLLRILKNDVTSFILYNAFFLFLSANTKDRYFIFKYLHFIMSSKGMFLVASTLDFKTRMEIWEVPIWVKVPHFPFVFMDTNILKLIKDNLGCYIEDVEIKTRIIQVVVDLR